LLKKDIKRQEAAKKRVGMGFERCRKQEVIGSPPPPAKPVNNKHVNNTRK